MTSSIGVRQRDRSAIKQRILEAAEAEFEQHGFEGTTMQAIADRAELAKANVHYYFKTKLLLYRAVLDGCLQRWNSAFDQISVDDDPTEAIINYIRAKMDFAREHGASARIFTHEMLSGAPYFIEELQTSMRVWTQSRASIFEQWVKQGKIKPIEPYHLIYLIWGATQYYSDYEVQITAHYGKSRLSDADFEQARQSITTMVLRICGLEQD